MTPMTGLFDDYQTRAEIAAEFGVSERTIIRWQTLPDGLPFTEIGHQKLYHKPTTLAWLKRREKHPNPRRRAA
jgi:hypothetical protein